MKKEFSIKTREIVQGIHPNSSPRPLYLSRTPLHVPFSLDANLTPAEKLDVSEFDNPECFNAVGSLMVGSRKHKPVIDVDGGARTQKVKKGSKVILQAAHDGTYSPDSMLRDVLGDYGIEAEIFTCPILTKGMMSIHTSIDRLQVGSIILRSLEADIFEAVASTSKDHSHLYIQKGFLPGDHKTLIKELGSVGIISPGWQALVAQEGMGIVRTPWTEKEVGQPSGY
jgi:hypothetical protein